MTSRKRTSQNKKKALHFLKYTCGNVWQTCKAINISNSTYYEWLKRDHAFSTDVDAVLDSLRDYSKQEIIKEKLLNLKDFENLYRKLTIK